MENILGIFHLINEWMKWTHEYARIRIMFAGYGTFCQARLRATFFFWSNSLMVCRIFALSFSTILFFFIRSLYCKDKTELDTTPTYIQDRFLSLIGIFNWILSCPHCCLKFITPDSAHPPLQCSAITSLMVSRGSTWATYSRCHILWWCVVSSKGQQGGMSSIHEYTYAISDTNLIKTPMYLIWICLPVIIY